jgi:two-component system sensor histidine kinase YesM
MKKHMFYPSSIFGRLLLSFCIIMLPFEITGIIIFTWGQNTVRKEIENSAASQVKFLNDDFENQIRSISSQLERVVTDTNIHEFALNYENLNTSDFYISLREQYDLISTIPQNFPILDDIVLYYQDFNKALSANDGYISVTNDSYEKLITSLREYSFPIKYLDSKIVIGLMYPVETLFNQMEPVFLVSMNLSNNAIRKYLSSFNNYDTILLNHSTMTAIYSSNQNDLSSDEYNLYFKQIDQALTSDNDTTLYLTNDDFYIITEYSQYLNCSFIQFVPISEIMSIPRQYNWYLILFTIISICVLIIYSFVALKLVDRPVSMLLGAFHKIESGNFDVHLHMKHPAKEYESLINGFNKMAKRLDQTINQLYKQEIYSQRMELKHLQMQINPHFLYNSYFVLHRLIIQEDLENAKQLSTYMGKYFQYITRNGQDKVPLQLEWEHARNYMEIQGIRYSIRITIKVDSLPQEYANVLVPRLILQPILENAFEHGLKDKAENGLLELKFINDDNFIHIRIVDNGEELSDENIELLRNSLENKENPNSETTALINIHRRLKLEFGPESGIFISPNKPNGLMVTMLISKKYSLSI